MPTPHERFLQKVKPEGEHHRWTGATKGDGVGVLKWGGKLTTAPRVAWEIAHGPLPPSARVQRCPDDPLCVFVEHLSLFATEPNDDGAQRSARGGGSKREISSRVWQLTVTSGADDKGVARRAYRTIHGIEKDATRALAAFVAEVEDGETVAVAANSSKSMTVTDLVDWYLDFARDDRGLDHSTLVGYREVYGLWLKGALGHVRATQLSASQLDAAFGAMRRAGLSRSRMNNARALLSGAFKWGRRHGHVHRDPVAGFKLPASSAVPKQTMPPELSELIEVLNAADEHDAELAPVLKLGAVTGMRRGELSGLRRDRVHVDRCEIYVDRAINDAGGIVVDKTTKTRQTRVVSIDAATVEMLRQHFAAMDSRAKVCGATIAADGFVFSLDVDCSGPMRPELITRRMRQLRSHAGLDARDFDATVLALRKWTTSELMDAGFNPSTVSGRQGHTVQVMLAHYSKRRRSADVAAAAHLGQRVHGSTDPKMSAS